MAETTLETIASWQANGGEPNESLADAGQSLSPEEMARWLETLMRVQMSAISTDDFFQQAADAIVRLIGLDQGLIVLKKQNQWQVTASATKTGDQNEKFSKSVLERVMSEHVTFFESDIKTTATESLNHVTAFVASPLFDITGEVAGVLFGSRTTQGNSDRRGIRKIEAMVVQFLAGIVSAGMARQFREDEADRFHAQLEQFASPKLVQAMSADPAFLEAKDREITALFGDVRGFTVLAKRVGPARTFSMIRNLMDQLTGCILDEDGFIINYAGDGIAAMWNAPTDQPDHSELACWAAINMQNVMDKLSEFWSFVAGESLSTGIGINTGVATVGNGGSRWRLKYTPIGSTVNLASRLEGATKYFGATILITDETRKRLFTTFDMRRVGPVVVQGFDQPVQVYQVLTENEQSKTGFKEICIDYENALQLFEKGDFHESLALLESLLGTHRDAMADKLVIQIHRQLANPQHSPALRLEQK